MRLPVDLTDGTVETSLNGGIRITGTRTVEIDPSPFSWETKRHCGQITVTSVDGDLTVVSIRVIVRGAPVRQPRRRVDPDSSARSKMRTADLIASGKGGWSDITEGDSYEYSSFDLSG
ncbi:MAG: hypothetical protein AAGD33_12825 [Actinomycetota bacterium]